jgi:hypothetical protein
MIGAAANERMVGRILQARLILFLTFLIVASHAGLGSIGCAQVPTAEETSASEAKDSPLTVQFGLGGAVKLGQLVPVRLRLNEDLRKKAKQVEVESIDGDGVTTVYSLPLTAENLSSSGVVWHAIRVGRQGAELTFRVLGPEGLLYTETFELDAASQVLPSDQPLVVALGDAMGIDGLSRRSADGSSANFSTVVLTRTEQLPLAWSDYSSCDLIVISGKNIQLLQNLQAAQWQALDAWIRRGGACVIALGEQAQELAQLSTLLELLPGPVIGQGQINNPAALESLVATDEPLDSFACCLVQPTRGKVELTLNDALARPIPWWLSYSHGLGTIRFVASDLGDASFNDWQDRQRLWGRLIAPYLDKSVIEVGDEKQVGDSSYLGYSDMVGQLRATLDVFPEVRVVSFGQIAAMLIAVLLLIGPIDYFVSVKWLKRPELSWIFAGGILLAVTLGLMWLLAVIRPQEVRINTAQVIDVDESSGIAQGRLWSHVYSGSARELDIAVQASAADDIPVRLDWQGLPGRGLGGLLSSMSTDRGMPKYIIESQPSGHTQMLGVGIPTAGTKCLVAHWNQPMEFSVGSKLREIPGVDQLEGELTNPLDVDLLDPVLFYHNWFYSLNSRIPAGKSTMISFDTIPKDITRRLNGRHSVDGNETTIKWDPSSRTSIDRLLELMMFYKSAAGQSYTTLAHRYQPHMDHSNLLQTDRAILVGRLEQPWSRVVVTNSAGDADAPQLEVQQDLDRVWCRIAIPVQQNTKK